MNRCLLRCLPLFLLFGAISFLLPNSANGQKPEDESDKFFNGSTVLRLEIEIGKKEMDLLRREPRKYVKATLKEGDKVVGTDVGIHLKGAAGSFRSIDEKPGLTLNMDKFTDGQRYRGMDKFHLSNSVQDPSYLSELICGELFRAAGVPASRIGHAVVSINGKRRGLYYVKEGYDTSFLKHHFNNSDGNFYDGGFLREIDQPLQLIKSKNDVKEYADLKALAAACNEKNHDQRFQKLEKLLDLDKFVAFIVLEAITWDWDGYPFNRNNYRIYHDPRHDKITFIPSGMDQMFGASTGPILPDFQGLVARALISTPKGKALYYEKMADIMKKVYSSDKLIKRLDELEARIQPVLAEVDAGAGKDYKNQVNRLRHSFKDRQKSVEEQLSKIKK
ncbi:MAG: CotH kinase family protein [Planctomycetes bacterium]|nr:CotH kinase family protein [Planctomycetota bacterium]